MTPDERAAAAKRLAEQLRDAAAAHRERPRPVTCQLGGADTPCGQDAELKIADWWGDPAWFVASCPVRSMVANVERADLRPAK
jgi:hypothetical protein